MAPQRSPRAKPTRRVQRPNAPAIQPIQGQTGRSLIKARTTQSKILPQTCPAVCQKPEHKKGLPASRKTFLQTVAVWTGLEPATSAVTGRHSNQLNYQTVCRGRKRGRFPLWCCKGRAEKTASASQQAKKRQNRAANNRCELFLRAINFCVGHWLGFGLPLPPGF